MSNESDKYFKRAKMSMRTLKLCYIVFITIFLEQAIAGEANHLISDSKYVLSFDRYNNSIGCNAYTEYHQNGKIKEVGCQGEFHGQGTLIGTVYEYSEDARLIRSTYYHPDEYGKDYKVIRDYDKDGNIISEKFFNNDYLYEMDEIQLNKKKTLQKLFKGETLYSYPD